MKHAFMILAHGNFKVLTYLLKCLDDERNDLYVHVDAKAQFDESAFAGVCSRSRLVFIPRRKVRWGGLSQTRATLALMAAASEMHHDYYHLLSGVDMPLLSNDQFDAFIQSLGGKLLVHYPDVKNFLLSAKTHWLFIDSPVADWTWMAKVFKFRGMPWHKIMYGLDRRLTTAVQRFFGVDRTKKIPYTLATGLNWVSLPEDALRHVLAHKDEFLAFSKHTFASDERLTQTLILNSEFYSRVFFADENTRTTHTTRYSVWHNGSPVALKSADYDKIVQSGMLFARKFDENIDLDVVERLYRRVAEMNART